MANARHARQPRSRPDGEAGTRSPGAARALRALHHATIPDHHRGEVGHVFTKPSVAEKGTRRVWITPPRLPGRPIAASRTGLSGRWNRTSHLLARRTAIKPQRKTDSLDSDSAAVRDCRLKLWSITANSSGA
jgi:hypothetical protein